MSDYKSGEKHSRKMQLLQISSGTHGFRKAVDELCGYSSWSFFGG